MCETQLGEVATFFAERFSCEYPPYYTDTQLEVCGLMGTLLVQSAQDCSFCTNLDPPLRRLDSASSASEDTSSSSSADEELTVGVELSLQLDFESVKE